MIEIIAIAIMYIGGMIFLWRLVNEIGSKRAKVIMLVCAIVINIFVFPLALFIGGMATDAPTSGVKEFFKGFLFIQGLPLAFLIMSIVLLFIRKK